MRVVLVDDDPVARRSLERVLSSHPIAKRWARSYATCPSAVLQSVLRGAFDVVVTDLRFGEGEMSGINFIHIIRASENPVPIILYTAYPWDSHERAECLHLGASDVVHKPLDSVEELIARIAKLAPQPTRSSGVQPTAGVVSVGALRVDARGAAAYVGERKLKLTPNSRALLLVLAAVFPRHATHAELLQAMGYANAGSHHALVEAVRQLRKQLDGSVTIEAVAGVGYRLMPPPKANRRA